LRFPCWCLWILLSSGMWRREVWYRATWLLGGTCPHHRSTNRNEIIVRSRHISCARHEFILGCGSIPPFFPKFIPGRTWVISFTLQPLHRRRNTSSYQQSRRLHAGPRADFGCFERRKFPVSARNRTKIPRLSRWQEIKNTVAVEIEVFHSQQSISSLLRYRWHSKGRCGGRDYIAAGVWERSSCILVSPSVKSQICTATEFLSLCQAEGRGGGGGVRQRARGLCWKLTKFDWN
jgi:hypothetical protein